MKSSRLNPVEMLFDCGPSSSLRPSAQRFGSSIERLDLPQPIQISLLQQSLGKFQLFRIQINHKIPQAAFKRFNHLPIWINFILPPPVIDCQYPCFFVKPRIQTGYKSIPVQHRKYILAIFPLLFGFIDFPHISETKDTVDVLPVPEQVIQGGD